MEQQQVDGEPTASRRQIASAGDYMLRTTQQTLLQQSAIADTKASIVITAASIVATVSVGELAGAEFRIAIAVVGAGAVMALAFAVIAVLPKFGLDPRGGRRNGSGLLFFGSFAHMSREDYETRMLALLRDRDAMNLEQIRSIHGHGRYLERHKYRYLRFAYIALLSGVVMGALVYAVETL